MKDTREIKYYLSQNEAYRKLKIVEKWNCSTLSLKDIYELVKAAEVQGRIKCLESRSFDKYGLEI